MYQFVKIAEDLVDRQPYALTAALIYRTPHRRVYAKGALAVALRDRECFHHRLTAPTVLTFPWTAMPICVPCPEHSHVWQNMPLPCYESLRDALGRDGLHNAITGDAWADFLLNGRQVQSDCEGAVGVPVSVRRDRALDIRS